MPLTGLILVNLCSDVGIAYSLVLIDDLLEMKKTGVHADLSISAVFDTVNQEVLLIHLQSVR